MDEPSAASSVGFLPPHLEHGDALDPVVCQVAERRVGLVEPIGSRGHLDADAGRDGQELAAVVALLAVTLRSTRSSNRWSE